MSFVPKVLPNSDSDSLQREAKEKWEKLYNSTHIKLIENASKKDPRSAAEIFLFEWSTTGRRRPTVVHLLDLLKAANLYRAADYIAINVLQQRAVERPTTGPAAKISISELDAELDAEDENVNPQVSNVTIENNLDNSKPENTLRRADAPKLLVPFKREGATGGNTENKRSTARIGQENIPEVQITEATSSMKVGNIVLQSPPASEPIVSDMMKFSQSLSISQDSETQSNYSDSSESVNTSSVACIQDVTSTNVISGDNRPNFSQLLSLNSQNNIESSDIVSGTASVSSFTESSAIRPNLSVLLDAVETRTYTESTQSENGENRPDLSGLLASTNLSVTLISDESKSSNLLSQSGSIKSEQLAESGPAFSMLLDNNNAQMAPGKPVNESFDDSSSSDDE